MTTGSKFIPPKPVFKKDTVDTIFTSRLERAVSSFRRAGFDYHNRTGTSVPVSERNQALLDGKERRNIDLQREYPDSVQTKVLSLSRVLLPKEGMFQFEDGSIDEKGKVRACITMKILVEILDEVARKKYGYKTVLDVEGNAGQCIYSCGKFPRPGSIETLSVDKHGNITDARIKDYLWTFYIPDDKKTLDSLIKKWGKPVKGETVCVANVNAKVDGSNPYSAKYTVIDKEAFYSGVPVEDIILSSKANLPVSAAKAWEAKKQQLIAGGTATELQLSKLTPEDILNALKHKESTTKK